jgi:hypothetical protein
MKTRFITTIECDGNKCDLYLHERGSGVWCNIHPDPAEPFRMCGQPASVAVSIKGDPVHLRYSLHYCQECYELERENSDWPAIEDMRAIK